MWQEILTFGKFLLYCNMIVLYYIDIFILDLDLVKIAFHKSS